MYNTPPKGNTTLVFYVQPCVDSITLCFCVINTGCKYMYADIDLVIWHGRVIPGIY